MDGLKPILVSRKVYRKGREPQLNAAKKNSVSSLRLRYSLDLWRLLRAAIGRFL